MKGYVENGIEAKEMCQLSAGDCAIIVDSQVNKQYAGAIIMCLLDCNNNRVIVFPTLGTVESIVDFSDVMVETIPKGSKIILEV